MKSKFFSVIILELVVILISFKLSYANETSVEQLNQINIELLESNYYDDIYIDYDYDEDSNKVTAKIISNIKMAETKPTWTLSEDGYTYSKVFSENMNYITAVTDENGNVSNVEINITQIKDVIKDVEYEYDDKTNKVTAKIISNIKMVENKPTWTLSEDGYIYSKVFSENMNYITAVTDENGNVSNVEINITQIKDVVKDVEYEYDDKTNKVTAKIISNIKMVENKPTWTLSEDGYIYSKVFSENMNYITAVTDENGNVCSVEINITQIKELSINLEYEYNEENNQVTVKIISNIQLADTKPTWTLGNNDYIYSKVYTSNQSYITPVTDIYGNTVNVQVNITQIDDTAPEITVLYELHENNTVTIYLKSNKKLANTKPTWTLSEDEYTYSKVFGEDQDYLTTVQAINGMSTNVKIDIKLRNYTYVQDDESTIYVRYLYKGELEVIVQIQSTKKLANTKPTWILSDDCYTYTKTFSENTIYTTPVQDIDGSIKNVTIIINAFSNNLVGIDVSSHQGKVNWAEVKNAGIDFVILRCGYGENITSQDDKYFLRNVEECERLGIKYGVYLYSYALTVEGAKSEAQHVLRLIQGHKIQYGVWIDMEDADGYKSRNGMPSNETLVNICSTFCDIIEANGYDAGIYASYYWFKTKLASDSLDNYNKWVAQWSSSCSYTKPYKMWQYTSTGTVSGISSSVDMNVYYR